MPSANGKFKAATPGKARFAADRRQPGDRRENQSLSGTAASPKAGG
jgi:hypothetical protein